MKYIRIKNSGIIEPQALYLVGASTKRGDHTKIGQFGSGNKYALAYLLRNGYQVKVFAGLEELTIHTEKEKFRDQEFEIIYVNGSKTSITTEMGKDWEFWQAIREIYCNAKDEGNCTLEFVQNFEPKADETHFYIDTKHDVFEFMSNYDNYFSFEKKVLFECEDGRILEKTGSHVNVYRKGINCFKTTLDSVFDYDFSEITIDENRLVKYSWQVEEKIWSLIYQCNNKDVIMQILHQCSNDKKIESNISSWSDISCKNPSETFIKCLKESRLCPLGYAGMLKPDEVMNHILIPTRIFQELRGLIADENVGDKFKTTKTGVYYRELETITALYDATINKALDFLKEVHFDMNYPIKVALFDEKEVMGTVQYETIILSDICVKKGINEVVNTIIEEYIHIKYQVFDETRGFQTAIISELITYMKNVNTHLF